MLNNSFPNRIRLANKTNKIRNATPSKMKNTNTNKMMNSITNIPRSISRYVCRDLRSVNLIPIYTSIVRSRENMD